MWRKSAAIRFLLEGTSPASKVVACLLMSMLAATSDRLAEAALRFIAPPGGQLLFSSALEPRLHLALARFTLAALPAFGWTIAAARGYRRESPTGVEATLGFIAAITAVAFVVGGAELGMDRAMWSEAMGDTSLFRPMVSIGELRHWQHALAAAFFATAGWIWWEARRERRSGMQNGR